MNIKDFKNKVKKSEKKDVEDEDFNEKTFEQHLSKLKGNVLPFLIKNVLSIVALFVSSFLYFIYSVFAHTKEVAIVFLIVGAIILLPKLYLSILKLINKNKK